MSTWFCCGCGDGPHSSTLVGACTSCGHVQCTGCSKEDHYHANKQSTVAAPTSLSPPTTSSAARSNAPHTLGLGLEYDQPIIGASHSASHGHIRTDPSTRRGGPVDGTIIYRWTCCKCHGDNSCEYDKGCCNCHDHWRQGCCTVYKHEYD
ncbi:hypothetical protein CC86DRAFT_461134 [Ophiobolus disseminans]|uniref:Uncharacterized protein n=1 Tax=Ophiobolus disseminans TaxID=1469910 RepID=A0A6A6ZBJ5_9PLEO|nr:hypothetical protein CC86DRAFT_461134 [Ophiobolus disseminans]